MATLNFKQEDTMLKAFSIVIGIVVALYLVIAVLGVVTGAV